jgi:hypothetical protein
MKNLLALFILLIVFTSCKKETEYIYEVNDVQVRQDATGKGFPKSTIEFLSIAYSDIYGNTISQNQLNRLSLLYLAFGDKKLLEDLLIKNMINRPEALLPSNQTMRSDVDLFVVNAYQKLYNRSPNELEVFTLKKNINENAQMTAVMVYYAMMTSDEYRYY